MSRTSGQTDDEKGILKTKRVCEVTAKNRQNKNRAAKLKRIAQTTNNRCKKTFCQVPTSTGRKTQTPEVIINNCCPFCGAALLECTLSEAGVETFALTRADQTHRQCRGWLSLDHPPRLHQYVMCTMNERECR